MWHHPENNLHFLKRRLFKKYWTLKYQAMFIGKRFLQSFQKYVFWPQKDHLRPSVAALFSCFFEEEFFRFSKNMCFDPKKIICSLLWPLYSIKYVTFLVYKLPSVVFNEALRERLPTNLRYIDGSRTTI